MNDDDVIKLHVRNKRQDDGKLFLVPPPREKCKHYKGPFEVDDDAGTCKCMECGDDVSPMFVLKRLMNKESQWNRTREKYQDEMKRLSERSKTKCEHCGQMTRISRR